MKLTLDRLCITSKRLCNNCNKKLERGIVSEVDIEIGNILLNAAKSQKNLNNLSVTNIIETSGSIYIILQSGNLGIISNSKDHLLSQLAKYSDKQVTFLEKTKNTKKLIEDLLSPIIPVSTSTVMLPPDGEKELKVQVKQDDKSKILSSMELSQVTRAILGMYAHYTYV
ncbi:MAG: hypothetical protein ACXAE3_03790 [Candidatus Kariarchaeaceae archaeon]|jgi:transcription antitermination factor NusA-like protein